MYVYKCKHDVTEPLEEGIRKCSDCGIVIITNRGI